MALAAPSSSQSPTENIERELFASNSTASINALLLHRIRVAAATEFPKKGISERLEEALWPLYGGKPEWSK